MRIVEQTELYGKKNSINLLARRVIGTNNSYLNAGWDLLFHFRKCGFSSWLIGGIVRDQFLNREPNDVDLIFQGRAEDLFDLFPRAVIKGRGKRSSFIIVHEGRQFEVEPLGDRTLEEDLERRDFTINSIAMDPDRKIIDPFGGIKDLKRSLLRFTSNPEERIREDPVRLIRFCRMISTLGFSPEKESSRAVKRWSSKGLDIPPERMGQEVLRALDERVLSRFMDCMTDHGLIPVLYPAAESFSIEEVRAGLRYLEDLSMGQSVIAASFFYGIFDPKTVLDRWNWPVALKREILALLRGGAILSSGRTEEMEIALLAFDPGVSLSDLVSFARFTGTRLNADFEREDALFRNLDIFSCFARNIEKGPPLPGGEKIMGILNTGPGEKVGKAKRGILLEIARGRIRAEEDINLYLKSLYRE